MKVNEIQIGDWVKISRRNKIGKVYRIDAANGKGNGYAAVIDGDYHEMDLEPIPLTPEILEKNGWVRTKYCYGRDCMELHGADELPEGVDNALSMARWSIDNFYQYHFLDLCMWKGNVSQHDVHFVHQLQHAFRIFGIEKEIEL